MKKSRVQHPGKAKRRKSKAALDRYVELLSSVISLIERGRLRAGDP
jgi:hypothetical protein